MSTRNKLICDRICGACLVMVIFTINCSSVVAQGSPLWGNNKPRDKECLDFCNLFNRGVCNNGKCFMNSVTCRVECFCEEGYTGRWCKSRVTEEKMEETGVRNKTDEPFVIRRKGGGVIWKPKLKLPMKGVFSKPRFTFKIEESKPKIENISTTVELTTTIIIDKESNITSQISNKTEDSRSPNVKSVDITITQNDSFTVIQTGKQENPAVETTTSLQSVMAERNVTSPLSTVRQSGTFFPFYTSTEQPIHGEINKTILAADSDPYLSSCEMSCDNGECRDIDGKYECIEYPGNETLTTAQDTKECATGFVCKHGHCDQENLKRNRFKCVCDAGWIGDLCDISCELDCGKHGICFHETQNKTEMACMCDPRYTGVRCQRLRPIPTDKEDSPWHWYVVGISIALVTVFVLTMVMLPFWLWKKRMVFVMRIVHYFQHYEEDDGKKFDAFISYKSSKEDEKFVLQKLYPKLELEMGFKLCMHFRDFTPGDAIANNIIKAIEDSRRTIMILSANYVNSEWCRMEYQKAQHEMLKMRHKIIPVVLDDITMYKNMDKNLKTILSTVTYLEWPTDNETKKIEKFWKQLALSLPKKRSVSSENGFSSISSTSLSTNVSNTSQVTSLPSRNTYSPTNNESSYSIQMGDSSGTRPHTTEKEISTKPQDSHTGRLRKMMKDVLKLKINSGHSRPLTRESSADSSISTPLSDTPSPGVYSGKDFTPLLSRRVLQGGRPINYLTKKSSTWSYRNKGRENERSSVHHSHSLRERDSPRASLDIIPQTPTTADSNVSNLPDVCRISNVGYYNILCEEPITPSPITFLQNNIFPTRHDLKESNIQICEDTVLNISPTLSCPTCVIRNSDENNVLSVDDKSNLEMNTNIMNTVGDTNCDNCFHPTRPTSHENNLNISNEVCNISSDVVNVTNPMYLNIDFTGDRRTPSCPTCVWNSNPNNLDNYVPEQRMTQCPTCVLQCHVDNEDQNQNVLQLPLNNETVVNHMNFNIVRNASQACCAKNEDKNAGPNSNKCTNTNLLNTNISHCSVRRQENNNSVLNNLDSDHPIPPVRLKKLYRMSSKESLS